MAVRSLPIAFRIVLLAILLAPVAAEIPAHTIPVRLLAIEYRDLDGDRDPFPDTGETGRVVVTLANDGPRLVNLTFDLTSGDQDVACISASRLTLAEWPEGGALTLGSLDPALPGFTFKAGDLMQTDNPATPARVDLCLQVRAEGTDGILRPICFALVADLDLPAGGAGTPLAGPDGTPGTADDGTLFETFDVDRDGDGAITVRDAFRIGDDGTGLTSSGSYLRAGAASTATGTLGGVACGGYQTVADGNAACVLDPDFPMDWHLHCLPGAGNCPNLESGACVGGCSYATPANGRLALSPPNSLHMGAHFNLQDRRFGDTTHFRTLQAFVSPPLNVTLLPGPDGPILSMFHIVDLMDNNGVGGGGGRVVNKCADCADVQVQVDADADPTVDAWGIWDRLVPFQNVYDHVAMTWSVFRPIYCLFTPTDNGTGPPAPRGVRETMCSPQGVWSHCGSAYGNTTTWTLQCPGPGHVDPTGTGVWVETKFSLLPYLGQRIRIRWIGSSWAFDGVSSSYFEYGGSWATTQQDDGWWLDDVRLTGLVTQQTPGVVDGRPAPGGTCPVAACAPVPDGIFAWWPFDGNAVDVVGGRVAVLEGNAGFAPGQVGSALSLDGDGDALQTPLVVEYAGGVTIAAWIRAAGIPGSVTNGTGPSWGAGTRITVGRDELSFWGQTGPEGFIAFSLHGGFVSGGAYHHVAATWTGDTTPGGVNLYVDGLLVDSATANSTIAADAIPLRLGDSLAGQIDEFAVYGRPLDAGEIAALYAASRSGKCRPDACFDTDADGYGFPGHPDCPAGHLYDCDDGDPAVHPAALEVCDGIDNDCDSRIDDLGSTTCGTGACTRTVQNCVDGMQQSCVPGDPVPETCNGIDDDCDGLMDDVPDADGDGVGPCAGDCDDANPAVRPGAVEACDGIDNDCDGRIDGLDEASCGTGACARTVPSCVGGVQQFCVPGDPAPETCNSIDDDCDGLVDDVPDADGDGVGPCAGDCDDADPAVHPGAAEVCDGIDNDCDGGIDDLGQTSCGTGACARTVDNCAGGVPRTCVPGDPDPETCNGVDDDCDGLLDNAPDADGDGFLPCAGDCDDTDPAVYPGALEICDGIDNDCDSRTDDLGQTTCGVGACTRTVDNCAGGVTQTCVPGNPAPEMCNAIDDDCDGSLPVGDEDADGDGWPICAGDCDDNDPLVYPGTQEVNDGIDNDCPGAPGYGLVDDVGDIRFVSQGRLCWPAQSGATLYDVARGAFPDFAGSCVVVSVASNCLDDTSRPPLAYHYLVRARGPFTGSWGADSAGNERALVCGQ